MADTRFWHASQVALIQATWLVMAALLMSCSPGPEKKPLDAGKEDMTPPFDLGQGGWNLEEVAPHPFPVGAQAKPADHLPTEILGHWVDKTASRPRRLLILPGDVLELKRDKIYPGGELAYRDVFSVKQRAGGRYLIRFASEETDRTLEVVGGRLESTFVYSLRGVRLLERWERVSAPPSSAPWADRAAWALDEVLTPHRREAAEWVLRWVHWPLRSVSVRSVYGLRYQVGLDLVVAYQADGQDLYWLSLMRPPAKTRVRHLRDMVDGPRHPNDGRSELPVSPLMGLWVNEHIMPLLPAAGVDRTPSTGTP